MKPSTPLRSGRLPAFDGKSVNLCSIQDKKRNNSTYRCRERKQNMWTSKRPFVSLKLWERHISSWHSNHQYIQEKVKVREWISHIGLTPKVIPFKIFLDIVPSSFEDVTRAMRGQPKRRSELHASPHIHIWIRHSMYGYIWIRQYRECALYVG